MSHRTREPLISVITPSFNQGRYLAECVESVLSQGNYPLEHILCDNCSTDETHEVARRYPHLQLHIAPDRGQSDALNKALRLSRGRIIAWLNVDDYYLPGAFDAVVPKLLQSDQPQFIAGTADVVDEDGTLRERVRPRYSGVDSMITFWRESFNLCQPACFFTREVVDQVGFLREDLHFAMDYDFWLRVASELAIELTTAPLAAYRLHISSKTGLIGYDHRFRREWELISRPYWAPQGSDQHARYERECRAHEVALLSRELLATHKAGRGVNWRLYTRLLAIAPRSLLRNHLPAVFFEQIGRHLAAALSRASRRALPGRIA